MREQSTEKIPNYFAQKLQKKFDESTLAIVLYGSWLRGKRDTVVDLYVIVDNYRYLDSTVDKILTNFFSPNVSDIILLHQVFLVIFHTTLLA